MNKNAAIITICIFFLLSIGSASAKEYQIGVSPTILNIGVVERGESRLASFNILTTSTESFMVDMKTDRGKLNFFDKKGFEHMLSEYSEEDVSAWIDFINNPVYLDTEFLGGSGMRKVEQINFLINIPEDAEPGYHLAEISPTPRVPGGQSTGVNVVAIAKIFVLFRVSGEAIRSGELLDITGKVTGSRTKIDLFFHNTGTVTMSSKGTDIRVFGHEDEVFGSFPSNIDRIGPGEVRELTGYYNDVIEPGNYNAFANITYFSGNTEKESQIWIEKAAEVKTTGQVAVAAYAFPWWIIIVIVIVISYGVYRYW